MNEFISYTLIGVFTGAAYAIAASGLVLTYSTTRVFNIAHGAVGMVFAFVYWDLSQKQGLPDWLALAVVLLLIAPAFGVFLQRVVDNVGPTHFWVGMSKAPVMAAVIAGIGCRQGLEVGGDVESLGRRVTAAVVHAIFAIIMLDAVFALIYMELDL